MTRDSWEAVLPTRLRGALEFDQIKQSLPTFVPSRLFIYYNERAMEHTIATDSGAQIRDGIKSVGTIGAPPESDWPYVVANFAEKPPVNAFKDAPLGKALQYQRVPQVLNQMKGCLASGYPFVFGFTVYESFESAQVAQTGVAPMPAPNEQVLGGHAVVAVGYDDASQRFIIRNSWGDAWGMKGYFTFPYAYLTDSNLSDDFWTVQMVAKTQAQIEANKKGGDGGSGWTALSEIGEINSAWISHSEAWCLFRVSGSQLKTLHHASVEILSADQNRHSG